MNILFLTLLDFKSINEHNIYADLLREFKKNGHKIFAISPIERRFKQQTHIITEDNSKILRLKIGNTQKTNIIEKGISTILIEDLYIKGVKQYFNDIKFDLVLYSTPPITICKVIQYIKKRDNAKTYLLLKDIFPQNSVDLEMLSKTGLKGLLYKYFRNKEKKLYSLSDYIGCMSPANVKYLLDNNNEILSEKVEVCPNCIEPFDLSVSNTKKMEIRKKYNLPLDKRIFVYGGNLGKPQGVNYIINCLKKCINNIDTHFLIVGSGTEFSKLHDYILNDNPSNVTLMSALPKEDYDNLVGSCDVGMIFLDNRFTIPNFPSRLLSYMQAKLPVLACTDINTDIGNIITENNLGWWCESKSPDEMITVLNATYNYDLKSMGENSYKFLCENYSPQICYSTIINRIRN